MLTTSMREKALAAWGSADKAGKEMLNEIFGENIFIPKKKDSWMVGSFEEACTRIDKLPTDRLPYLANTEDPYERLMNYTSMRYTIAEVIQDGWVADYTYGNPKWYPWFEWDEERSAFVFSGSYCDYDSAGTVCGARLSFETEEQSDYFGREFIDIHNVVLTKQ